MSVREYPHQSCTLRLEGKDSPQEASGAEFSLRQPFKTVLHVAQTSLQGDGRLAQDLVSVLERYLKAYLRGEPQGMFSSTVAIRPLDFLNHRLTIREGDVIKQADITMTQLYDLTEVLADFAQDFPQIATWQPTAPKPVGLKSPATLAALFIGSISLTAGVTFWNNREKFQTANRDPEVTLTQGMSEDTTRPATLESAPAPTTPSAPESAPDAASLAPAAPAARTEPSADEQLRLRLVDAWRTPASISTELVYRVTVDTQGVILSAEPQDEAATEARPLTPFSAADTQAPDPLPEGSLTFTVRLGELNRVVVEAN
ncbi:MAG: hypothetical protein OHK0012_13310 [Synechococcales cyanobacterium]